MAGDSTETKSGSTQCVRKDEKIAFLKEQLCREQESADRWRRDYIMLFKSSHDIVLHDEAQTALLTSKVTSAGE